MGHARADRIILGDLRSRIAQVERAGRPRRTALPFGLAALDEHLPDGGLALGALHEVADGGADAEHGAAAALFVAGALARTRGTVLWCLRGRDLFAPALAGVGLPPRRVVYAEAGNDSTVLTCMEEGLRLGGGALAGVVGEVGRLPMIASKRLQLAAESSGLMAIALRRWRGPPVDEPTASLTRWQVTALPSAPLPPGVPGVGRARWRLELTRCRGGHAPATFDVEACDAQGRLGVPADLADRPAASPPEHRRAAG